jgi:hypothetical protein
MRWRNWDCWIKEAAKVRAIYQLRPLSSGQPWGIFFIEFEKKTLPMVVLRRILSHLVIWRVAGGIFGEDPGEL